LIKNSQPFGKKFQKTVGGGLTHIVVSFRIVSYIIHYHVCVTSGTRLNQINASPQL